MELAQTSDKAAGSGKVVGATFGSMVVPSSEKAAAFYRDQFGFAVKTTIWSSQFDANLGTPGAQLQTAEVTVPGSALSWRFIEFFTANIRNRNTRMAYASARLSRRAATLIPSP